MKENTNQTTNNPNTNNPNNQNSNILYFFHPLFHNSNEIKDEKNIKCLNKKINNSINNKNTTINKNIIYSKKANENNNNNNNNIIQTNDKIKLPNSIKKYGSFKSNNNKKIEKVGNINTNMNNPKIITLKKKKTFMENVSNGFKKVFTRSVSKKNK